MYYYDLALLVARQIKQDGRTLKVGFKLEKFNNQLDLLKLTIGCFDELSNSIGYS